MPHTWNEPLVLRCLNEDWFHALTLPFYSFFLFRLFFFTFLSRCVWNIWPTLISSKKIMLVNVHWTWSIPSSFFRLINLRSFFTNNFSSTFIHPDDLFKFFIFILIESLFRCFHFANLWLLDIYPNSQLELFLHLMRLSKGKGKKGKIFVSTPITREKKNQVKKSGRWKDLCRISWRQALEKI